ncbi:MAG TPA: recombination mediator RecR [Candidatus Cloacimonadota bacterium]|jgi:recombination protein RecR|nr:recombination mediator RecR [Candidatus Cloacimonadales bacterium]HPY96775.1 recombination mediator RecR [Candidatus Cloacimonadota bacterium]HQB41360.1 recombination mediator RecR [Candidatus Cloacimonadota bacterium]
MFSGKLLQLQQNLKNLPGIGEKTAQRLALFILSQNKEKSYQLADSIRIAVDSYTNCSTCNMLNETDPCPICKDPTRDESLLCIVESTRDVYHIESTQEYHGYYYVLGKLLSPVDGIGPKQLGLEKLKVLVQDKCFKEIIFAISPSTEGESTIHFIAEYLQDISICLTRLSTGIPYGSDMEYTGTVTLMNALKRRFPI